MTRISFMIVAVTLAASPAMAAWSGGAAADVAPANTVVNQRTAVVYGDIRTAYTAALNADTLLVGPGEWNCDLGGGGGSIHPYLQQDDDPDPGDPNALWPGYVSIIGSGAGNNSATDTIFNGNYNPVTDLTGQRLFMTLFGSHGSAGAPMQFKNFRVKGFRVTAFDFGGSEPDEGGYKATDPNTGYVEFDNLYIRCAEDAADGNPGLEGHGWGDGIGARMGDLSNVVVRNSMFDGKNAFGIRIAGDYSGSGEHHHDWLIEGNTFTNMKNGIVLNGGNVQRIQIVDNEFTNMTEYNRDDEWNSYGNAGVVMSPRGKDAVIDPGLIQDVLIEGNYFADNGYVPTEPNDPNPHPWDGNDILGECGIQAQVHTYGDIKNVMIRDNTFEETAGGGAMKSGVALKVTDYPRRDIINGIPTGTPGDMEYVSLDDNTFIGMIEEDVEGTTKGSVGLPSPVVYPVDMVGNVVVGCTKAGDTDADDDIDVADIDATAAGPGRQDLITKGLNTSVADTNLDYVVDILDLGNLANHYGDDANAPWGFGDCDTDGSTFLGVLDLGNIANDYNKHFDRVPGALPYKGTYSPPIPEPTTLALLALSGAALLRRRR